MMLHEAIRTQNLTEPVSDGSPSASCLADYEWGRRLGNPKECLTLSRLVQYPGCFHAGFDETYTTRTKNLKAQSNRTGKKATASLQPEKKENSDTESKGSETNVTE
jgi:hypothetical protein